MKHLVILGVDMGSTNKAKRRQPNGSCFKGLGSSPRHHNHDQLKAITNASRMASNHRIFYNNKELIASLHA